MANIFQNHPNDVRSHEVEVRVVDSSGKYQLDDDSILREKEILGFRIVPSPELYGIAALANPPISPNTSRPLATTEAIFNAYITINCGSDSIVETYHAAACINTINEPGFYSEFQFCNITPSKSYIEVADPANNAVVGSSFLMMFFYRDN